MNKRSTQTGRCARILSSTLIQGGPERCILLRSESPSGKCAKLHTVAASNNRDHTTRSLSSSPFARTINCSPGSQRLLEVTHQDHSIIACSRHLYVGVILRPHPVRGESHIQRNASGEVVTIQFWKVASCIKRNASQLFVTGLSYRHVSFVWFAFFPRTPLFCERSSVVYNVLDPSTLALNHWLFAHSSL